MLFCSEVLKLFTARHHHTHTPHTQRRHRTTQEEDLSIIMLIERQNSSHSNRNYNLAVINSSLELNLNCTNERSARDDESPRGFGGSIQHNESEQRESTVVETGETDANATRPTNG